MAHMAAVQHKAKKRSFLLCKLTQGQPIAGLTLPLVAMFPNFLSSKNKTAFVPIFYAARDRGIAVLAVIQINRIAFGLVLPALVALSCRAEGAAPRQDTAGARPAF